MRQLRLHVDVRTAMKLPLTQSVPVQSLEESRILLLHIRQELVTADQIRRGALNVSDQVEGATP